MKNIGITKETRKELKKFQDKNESVDDAVNRLLDLVGEELLDEKYSERTTTTINLHPETMKRVKSFSRLNESYGTILKRALYIVNKDNF